MDQLAVKKKQEAQPCRDRICWQSFQINRVSLFPVKACVSALTH